MKSGKLGRSSRLQAAKYLVDANVFLEVKLGKQKADACEKALRKFQRGELEGVVLDFAVDTVVIVMENYGKGWSEIRKFLSGFLGYKGLHVYFSSLLDRIVSTNHMKDLGLDFDDALSFQAMLANGIFNIISYDSDFDEVPNIRRILPESFL